MIINRLGAILQERDINKTAFATMIGRKRQWVYWLCKPTTSISTPTLDLLCSVLHVGVGDILVFVPNEITTPTERKGGFTQ